MGFFKATQKTVKAIDKGLQRAGSRGTARVVKSTKVSPDHCVCGRPARKAAGSVRYCGRTLCARNAGKRM